MYFKKDKKIIRECFFKIEGGTKITSQEFQKKKKSNSKKWRRNQ